MQELCDKIWSNPRFHEMVRDIERALLQKDLLRDDIELSDLKPANKAMQAAAILAASQHSVHRQAAYRLATATFELYGCEQLPLDQALRVVLSRLGNFPAIGTRAEVASALPTLPWGLAAEEIDAADDQTINVNGTDITLTTFQYALWKKLYGKTPVAISAPTSAGKSYVMQAFLTNLYSTSSENVVAYIVPTRALISQVSGELLSHLGENVYDPPTIITAPFDSETPLPSRAIYVMTQERLQLCLNTNNDFRVDVLVVDEAHSIAEGARGVLLQWVIDDLIKRKKDIQVIFASPLIRNLDIFARLFGLQDTALLPSTEPTVSQNFLLIDIKSSTKGRISIRSLGPGDRFPDDIGNVEVGHTLAGRKEKLVHIAACLGAGQSNIIYANGPAEAEDIALQLAEIFEQDGEPDSELVDLSDLIMEAVHEKYSLSECVKSGVAFHYSNMPAIVRASIERMAASGKIKFLSCTSTLLQGVNLPAKNIFMFAPEKGRRNPMMSTDFWNLSGRAGRLRKEFQGNIFLIEYDAWKEKPLAGPKDAIIVPAVENAIKNRGDELISVIRDEEFDIAKRNDADLETAFGRLLSDLRHGNLPLTLERAGIPPGSSKAKDIIDALEEASSHIFLPVEVTRQTPSISAHKQQKLSDAINRKIEQLGADQARTLLPQHPREDDAFISYSNILEMCHSILLGIDTSKGLHRFHALMAKRWMQGIPVPRIIDEQIKRQKSKSMRVVIRDTLEIIEKSIRFDVVRLFNCYSSVLGHALVTAGLHEIRDDLPTVTLFLEVGASDKTMISFITLGLSRISARKLNDLAARKDMDIEQAKEWLRTRQADQLGLSPLLQEEVRTILGSLRSSS